MSIEQIAVATAILSATISAGGLLLAWYRGSAEKRPRLARTLAGVTIASAIALIVALVIARPGGGGGEAAVAGTVTADRYREQLTAICREHLREADRIPGAEPGRPVYGVTLQLEKATLGKIRQLRPPPALVADHRDVLDLWGRRVGLLDMYYDKAGSLQDGVETDEIVRAFAKVDKLSRDAQRHLDALGVTPECNLFR
jgi:hypothetical protein